jgi:hypothetical protein
LSLNASVVSEPPVTLLRYLDVVIVLLAAPIMLLIGVPAFGYAVGGGAWILLRAVGIGVERGLRGTSDAKVQITVRLAYMLSRLFLLALAVVLARRAGGQDDGLTALVVIVFAFTVQLATSAIDRPRSR